MRAQPAITTDASAAIELGAGSLTDVATVTGLVNPITVENPNTPGADVGTVTFVLYGPDDGTCATPILTRADRPLALNQAGTQGTADSGEGHTPPGREYRWIASYSGDANNAPVSGACGDADEQTR